MKQFKLNAEENQTNHNYPVIKIMREGKKTYLWIGNDSGENPICFATMDRPDTLKRFVNTLVEMMEGWKPISKAGLEK